LDKWDLRRRAEACRKEADRCSDPENKLIWQRLAEHWLGLAREAEQAESGRIGDQDGGR